MRVTTDHPASSYGLPVILDDDGQVRGSSSGHLYGLSGTPGMNLPGVARRPTRTDARSHHIPRQQDRGMGRAGDPLPQRMRQISGARPALTSTARTPRSMHTGIGRGVGRKRGVPGHRRASVAGSPGIKSGQEAGRVRRSSRLWRGSGNRCRCRTNAGAPGLIFHDHLGPGPAPEETGVGRSRGQNRQGGKDQSAKHGRPSC